MQRLIQLRPRASWVGGVALALCVFGHGLAGAAILSKEDAKCVNSINKGAAKVASNQGKENSACIKNAGKGKLPEGQTI